MAKPLSLAERWAARNIRLSIRYRRMSWLTRISWFLWLAVLWLITRPAGSEASMMLFGSNVVIVAMVLLIDWVQRGYADLVERYEVELRELKRPGSPA